MDHHGRRIKTADEAMCFVQAGNATFTVVSVKTQTRFTYRVRDSEDGRVFFVGVLTGQHNESDYTYLGIIRDGQFCRTAKSRVSDDAPSVRAFRWVYSQLGRGRLPNELEFWHEGSCGRCGRTLTVPESIETGYGPECSTLMGISRAKKNQDFLEEGGRAA